jgi:hypothetical protein
MMGIWGFYKQIYFCVDEIHVSEIIVNIFINAEKYIHITFNSLCIIVFNRHSFHTLTYITNNSDIHVVMDI